MTRLLQGTRGRAVLWGIAGIVILAVLWELYKFFGPADGVVIFSDGSRNSGLRILPRANDRSMPHLWDMITALGEPMSGPGTPILINTVVNATFRSFGWASAGWAIAIVVAAILALAMQRWRIVEWGILPWVVVSQTVPLIAFAPVLSIIGAQLRDQGVDWPQWLTVAIVASYLAFFPITIGMLRGLQSAERTQLELMRSYAAGYWSTLVKLRLPAAVPYLLPALRLGAAAAVIGTLVAEVSVGQGGGIGTLLVGVAGSSGTSDPAKPWGPVLGALALGLAAAGVVALIGLVLARFRRGEEA